MKEPATPHNEAERQRVLDALNLVYSPTEERFNRITRVASRLFDVPIALISLVTEDKQWFKSCQGLTTSETPREISFCGHAINQDDVFVVPNAAHDPDFSDNPLVTGEPRIRFYAGQPLTIDGQRIGTLCIIDRHPRHLKPKDYDSLKSLASWVETEILAWKADKNLFIDQALTLENRDTYIDDLTGNLQSSVLDRLVRKLSNIRDKSFAFCQVKIAVNGLPDADEIERRQQLLKDISQTLHRFLGEKGLIAFDGDRVFTLVQYLDGVESVEALVSYYREMLSGEYASSPALSFETSAD